MNWGLIVSGLAVIYNLLFFYLEGGFDLVIAKRLLYVILSCSLFCFQLNFLSMLGILNLLIGLSQKVKPVIDQKITRFFSKEKTNNGKKDDEDEEDDNDDDEDEDK